MAAATILATDPTPICTTTEPGLIGTITDWLIMLMEPSAVSAWLGHRPRIHLPAHPVRSHPSALRLHRRTRHLSLPGAIIWATIGSVLGAWTLYGISRWVGLHRINLAADKIPGVSRKDVSKANDWFTKYGTWSVLIGRVIPVVRSLISIPAGFNRMNFLHFTGWTLLGSAVWNTILVSAGYLLGDQWCSIQGALGVFEDVVIAAVIVVIVWFVVRKSAYCYT